jgi:hypothetical protein
VVNVKASVIILPKIGDGIVVPNAFLLFHDPHNNINNPGKMVNIEYVFCIAKIY